MTAGTCNGKRNSRSLRDDKQKRKAKRRSLGNGRSSGRQKLQQASAGQKLQQD
jgi:hypothetical protein